MSFWEGHNRFLNTRFSIMIFMRHGKKLLHLWSTFRLFFCVLFEILEQRPETELHRQESDVLSLALYGLWDTTGSDPQAVSWEQALSYSEYGPPQQTYKTRPWNMPYTVMMVICDMYLEFYNSFITCTLKRWFSPQVNKPSYPSAVDCFDYIGVLY